MRHKANKWHPMSYEDRFWAKVAESDECWTWTGATAANGYGMFEGKTAHRVAYTLSVGPIPSGLVIDHLCRVRNCVRPSHLEACGRGENVMRGQTVTGENRRKTSCKRGHPFDDENTYIRPDGKRSCRECAREWLRQHR